MEAATAHLHNTRTGMPRDGFRLCVANRKRFFCSLSSFSFFAAASARACSSLFSSSTSSTSSSAAMLLLSLPTLAVRVDTAGRTSLCIRATSF